MKIAPTLRLHRDDSYLLDFEARVEAVEWSEDSCELALDRSAFYLESGGQPSDFGTLRGAPLLGLREADGILWHRLALDRADGPAVGEIVRAQVDRARRLDHLEQHSGQHILSAACVRVGAGDTVSFHLGRDESTLDLAGPEPTRERLRDALELANGCVLDDREFRIHSIDRADLARYPIRKDPGLEHDVLRLIEIDQFDWSLCGGTHARRAGEVGPIHVLGWEKNKGAWRIRFLAGRRTLRYLAVAHELLDDTARGYSIHWQAIPESMRAWRDESAALRKEVRQLRLERGEREGERLFANTVADARGLRCLAHWFGSTGMEEARAAVNRVVALGPSLLLAGGVEAGRAYWFTARSESLPEDLSGWNAGAALRAWLAPLGGKGGGNERFAQGSAPAPSDDSTSGSPLDAANLARLGLN